MGINWAYVKEETLWGYEDLIAKLLDVLAYSFIQEHYNHTMEEADTFSNRLGQGYLQNEDEAAFIDGICANFKILDALGVSSYQDLIMKVSTRANCEAFLQATDFPFKSLIQNLNFLFRWILPFRCPLREFVDTKRESDLAALEALKKSGIRTNLDLLETCRTRAGRTRLARETGVEVGLLLDLVHRADISRLAFVRGKTVKHLCAGGYDRLEKIAQAKREVMQEDMTAYYETLGKSFSDFKAVIPLDWMVGGAGALPKVVED